MVAEIMSAFIILGIVGIAIYLLYQRYVVKRDSERYKELAKINEWYISSILEHPNVIKEAYAFDTKAKFDNPNSQERIFDAFVAKNKASLQEYVDCAEQNQALRGEYPADVQESLAKILPHPRYVRMENWLLKKKNEEIRFPRSFTLLYRFSYTSPKGQNHYENTIQLSSAELGEYLKEVKANKKEQSEYEVFRDAERAKMTPGLRYDILKRDGFMCQLCGAEASAHGVTLHVDHIQPVARWGKTEPDNLQVLCRDCNLGKGVKD